MNEEIRHEDVAYEAPMMAEVGQFAELTRANNSGNQRDIGTGRFYWFG
jgi:hypothetical protein